MSLAFVRHLALCNQPFIQRQSKSSKTADTNFLSGGESHGKVKIHLSKNKRP